MQLNDVVPGTTYTAQELCRVKSFNSSGAPTVGTIMSRDGAFQRKYVITYIVHTGTDQHGNSSYLLGLQNLGQFYADHRVVPAVRSKVMEREVWISKAGYAYHIAGFVPVVPVGAVLPVKTPFKAAAPVKLPPKPQDPVAILADFQIK